MFSKGSCANGIRPTRWTIKRWLEHSGSNYIHWWIKSDTLVGSGRSVAGRGQGWTHHSSPARCAWRLACLSLLASVLLPDRHKWTASLSSALQSPLSASPRARRRGAKRTGTETEILSTFLFFPQVVSYVVLAMKVLLTKLKYLPTPAQGSASVFRAFVSGPHKQMMYAFLLKTQVSFK